MNIALAIGIVLVLATSPAFAINTSTGAYFDFHQILDPVLQGVGLILSGAVSALAFYAINWLRGKLGLQKLEKDSATQKKIDDVTGKIIGGAIARTKEAAGNLTIDVKSPMVADAAAKVAEVLGTEIKSLGSMDVEGKAREMVENRIGLMIAAQNGTPVPGTTTPPVPVAVASATVDATK